MKQTTCDYLVFDISNILYANFYADPNADIDTLTGLAAHAALVTLNKYFKMFKPTKNVIMAFDRNSWRKDYTASEECVSKKPYKGNRRQNLTPAQQGKYEKFCEHIKEFEQLIENHTTIIVLSADNLEADDLIAGFIQFHADSNEQIIIVSEDSDLQQLTKFSNVAQYGPVKSKFLTLEKFNNDPEYYLFHKCVRGDPTDNVQSAFPRVRSTVIEKAYNDEYDRINMMNETWTNENKIKFKVLDLYNENRILIDLEKQPEYIKDIIDTTLAIKLTKKHKFSMFHMLQYIGKHKLVKLKASIDQFLPLLSH